MILANPTLGTRPAQIRVVMRREVGIQGTNRWRTTPVPGTRTSRNRASLPVHRLHSPKMPMHGVPKAKHIGRISAQAEHDTRPDGYGQPADQWRRAPAPVRPRSLWRGNHAAISHVPNVADRPA